MFPRDVMSMESTSREGREKTCEWAEGDAGLTPDSADPMGALKLKWIIKVVLY